ncbi:MULTISPECIES: flagellar hook-associated protein FlgL [Aliiglaciecola]|uniref:flagellar hook-associated protein FlgL n=1 Tax=Aliiglaciecola TaxID=1406885 RepID=UPI001C0954C9|nr:MULTISPECIES: flagellar hook-associated protein FlgL [Aliiglaciecola]MBU2877975.1 flagellar hook-associated protein FlgL [Aliiglaciecola lipolytica]MDO6709340.1 flagellar hook-associated protein FlgL [Aliiglaciecola sp. 2_MG-2023]MDO6750488.1 flagellar hook-associated protein FlgL [Aliiglaciecola sp. 1_MG-2023]
MARISTNQLYDRSINTITQNQGTLSDVQQQLSSGKKLLRPSDDPVGAAQVVRLTEDLDKITQFKRNNDLLANSLQQEEVVLRNINSALDKARQLMVQSGNGVYDESDLQAIGIEIGAIRDEVFSLMNTQNSNGEFIFAGYQSQTEAFTYNPSAVGEKYTFSGDDGVKKIQVSDALSIQSNSSGKSVFENVQARLNFSVTGDVGISSISSVITEQAAFDKFHKNNYDAVTPANNQFQATILAGNQLQIDNLGSGDTIATVNFISGEPLVFNGIEFNVEGSVGNTFDFELDKPEKKNIAETLNNFYLALNNGDLTDKGLNEAIADALVGIDNGSKALANATSSLGGRMNVAESVYESNLDLEIANKTARANIEDVDYAEAVSELSKQETALQAAQATFSRVTGLTLFDYI